MAMMQHQAKKQHRRKVYGLNSPFFSSSVSSLAAIPWRVCSRAWSALRGAVAGRDEEAGALFFVDVAGGADVAADVLGLGAWLEGGQSGA